MRIRPISLLAILIVVGSAVNCKNSSGGSSSGCSGCSSCSRVGTSSGCSSGSGGGAPACTAGATRACYDGPAGSEDVGVCRGGLQTCSSDGTAWGACMGQTLPSAEVCGSGQDENCNGVVDSDCVMACTPGDSQVCYPGPPETNNIGTCRAGARTCLSDGSGWTDCAGEILPQQEACNTPQDEDCDGRASCVVADWERRFGAAGGQLGTHLAVDQPGNVILAGSFDGTIDLGGGPLDATGPVDAFIVKLDGGGAPGWGKRFGGTSETWTRGLTVDETGGVVIAGHFGNTVDFGGGPLTATSGRSVFVVKLDAAGNHVWSRRFGGSANQECSAVGVDGAGNVVVAGAYSSGAIDAGGGPMANAGGADAFVVKLDAAGNFVWAKRYGDAGDQRLAALAVTATGQIDVVGDFEGSIDIGGGALASAGGTDIFLAALDPSGNHVWSKRFGDSADQTATAVAADGTHVWAAGYFAGTIDFGLGSLVSAGGNDTFVASFSAAGAPLWNRRLGGPQHQMARALAVRSGGACVVAGSFAGAIDDGPLTSAGGEDVFVASLDGAGDLMWLDRFGDIFTQHADAVAIDADGRVILAGSFSGAIDFGGGLLTSAGDADAFVVALTP